MPQFNATQYDIERPTGRCAFTDRELQPGEAYFAALIELTDEQIAQMREAQAASGHKDKTSDAASGLGLKRLDVALEAWQQGARPENMFSYWKTIVPEPNKKKRVFVDDAVLMNLLRRLEDQTDPQRVAFRYVLALILMRKKLLRYDGSFTRRVKLEAQEDKPAEEIEQHWWKLTPKLDISKGPLGKWHDEERFEVHDPKLDESRIEEIMGQLGEILDGEF